MLSLAFDRTIMLEQLQEHNFEPSVQMQDFPRESLSHHLGHRKDKTRTGQEASLWLPRTLFIIFIGCAILIPYQEHARYAYHLKTATRQDYRRVLRFRGMGIGGSSVSRRRFGGGVYCSIIVYSIATTVYLFHIRMPPRQFSPRYHSDLIRHTTFSWKELNCHIWEGQKHWTRWLGRRYLTASFVIR
jgi:hypothetical protein